MIIDPSGDGRSDKLLYIKNGQVRESDIWAPGTISYKEKENLIINDSNYWNTDEKGTIFEVARIKKGKYFVDDQLQEIDYMDSLGNVENTEIKINSNYVSKEDYDEEIEKYRNLKGLKVFEFKYDTIKKAFKNLEMSPIDTSLLYNDKQLAKKREEKSFDHGSYVIAGSDTKKLKNKDLKNLSARELTYARNEIFARHGYVFNSPELNKFFKKKNWYTPDDSYDGKLSDVENKNIEFIKNYQAENDKEYFPRPQVTPDGSYTCLGLCIDGIEQRGNYMIIHTVPNHLYKWEDEAFGDIVGKSGKLGCYYSWVDGSSEPVDLQELMDHIEAYKQEIHQFASNYSGDFQLESPLMIVITVENGYITRFETMGS